MMGGDSSSFVIIGCGKMGEAILSGWLASDSLPASSIEATDITVVNPGIERRDFIEGAYGVACLEDVTEVSPQSNPDVVVLAVKPQVMGEVLDQVSRQPAFQGGADGPLFISIAAGLTTERIAAALPAGAPVVRVMPNMPLMVGAGASAVCGGANASKEHVDYVAALFGCLGRAVVVDESQMDAVCALSGSGPAYVAALIEAMRDAAVQAGLGAELAETLAQQTVLGTAQLLESTGLSPEEAREAVCSPGGTTLAALDSMYGAGFNEVIAGGINAAVVRSKELSEC